MIWEVDDDLDGKISKQEFDMCYKRVIVDDQLLEPRKFYLLIEFLMYNMFEVEVNLHRPNKKYITKEDCYKLMYVRQTRYRQTE